MFSEIFSVVMYCLNLLLLVLLLARNGWRRLVFFTLFIVLLTVRDGVGLCIAHTSLGIGRPWIYTYWYSELVLSTLYLFMIAEIAKRFFQDYPSIWFNASRLLAIAALALISWTVYSTLRYVGHPRMFVLIGDQRLDLTTTIMLLLLMAIGAYYRLRLPPLYRLMLIGIGIYASVQVVTDQIEIRYKMGPESLFGYLRTWSYAISLVVWIYAVWRWAAPPATRAELISQSKYDHLSPQVHHSLQEVNLKLANLEDQRL
jgi:hypothetical protein